MNFIHKLDNAIRQHDSLLCVGLDPDIARFPGVLKGRSDAVFEFCRAVIDATAPYACAFKPQIAYFAALAAEDQLQAICDYLKKNYPTIPIVLDAKRGDIGSTAEQYAREAFERYDADAVTLNPYMGFDSIQPYLEWKDRGAIVLCRTSNPGGSDLQFLKVDGVPLYQHVARLVAEEWNHHGQCGLVVGATFPHELEQVRKLVGDMPLLVPGIGAQGGDIEATVKAGRSTSGAGMMINSSRAILYAKPENDESFAAAASRIAEQTRDSINLFRHT